MKISYSVCHAGKKKSFTDVKKALVHAEALDKLGYDVKVYLVTEDVLTKLETLIFASKGTQEAEVLRKLRGMPNGTIKD